ncbi:hypothetical protein GA0070624_0915 [Micromonospora rhizosphaerae]|uniref:WD40-like Beta Propeller Repeat n=1 Tax=Micromonospora rhizosphaerae TaxID=568872 RepID=A0A1C6RFX6_9ACTN|nr:hypothetical protein [Micromonospora rhizosphaerae]SCL16073.1 hypothetical protein GA0070624_0915 [Micromonospora rhizosphaerae]
MNHDRLRLDLAALADEVTPVDLRDRALRTSRRLGIQRAVATSAAALVVLAAATGTALAIRPNGQPPAPQPAGPSVTSTWPPVEVTPTPAPSRASTEPSGSPSTSTATPPSVLTGTRYYLEKTSPEARIHAIRGRSDQVVYRIAAPTWGCELNTVTISPDGKRVAWVQDSTDGGITGVLLLGAPGQPSSRTLLSGVTCVDSNALVWKGNDHLMVRQRLRPVLIDVAAGKPVGGDPGQETDRCWSVDGRWLAAKSDGKPYVTDGQTTRTFRYTPPAEEAAKWGGWRARSVSLDGRYVSIGWVGTDPSRRDGSFTVVDTVTSKVIDLPVSGKVESIQFTADFRVLVRQAARIVVLDSGFRKLGEVAEPRDVQKLTLLAYVP